MYRDIYKCPHRVSPSAMEKRSRGIRPPARNFSTCLTRANEVALFLSPSAPASAKQFASTSRYAVGSRGRRRHPEREAATQKPTDVGMSVDRRRCRQCATSREYYISVAGIYEANHMGRKRRGARVEFRRLSPGGGETLIVREARQAPR